MKRFSSFPTKFIRKDKKTSQVRPPLNRKRPSNFERKATSDVTAATKQSAKLLYFFLFLDAIFISWRGTCCLGLMPFVVGFSRHDIWYRGCVSQKHLFIFTACPRALRT